MSQSHKIGLITATIIGMNAMIGSGIFTAPATLASYVGPAGILAYIFVVISVWFMAQSLARVAALFPEEGSFYAYAKPWSGHYGGLIASTSYLIGLVIAMGLLAQIAGHYLAHFLPGSPTFLGFASLCMLVLLNVWGVALSQAGQFVLITCTLFPLLAITVLCFSQAHLSNLTPFAPFGFANVLKATKIVIFGFFGFESAASLFTLVREPQKNVPRALTYSIIIVGIIYTLFVASIIGAVPLSLFANPQEPLSTTLSTLLPHHRWLIEVIHFSILSAIIGTIHSMIWGSSALVVSLAKKVHIPWVQSQAHQGMRSTRLGVCVISAGIALTFWLLDNPTLFFSLTALFIISAYIMSMITLLLIPSERTMTKIATVSIGILTACIILAFAVEGLAVELYKII